MAISPTMMMEDIEPQPVMETSSTLSRDPMIEEELLVIVESTDHASTMRCPL